MNNILYLLLKFFASILIPYLLRYIEPDATWSTKTLLGISVFLGWSSLDALNYLRRLDAERKRHTELWLLENEFDLILSNIRKHYLKIVVEFYGDSDLFKTHFHERFSDLGDALQAAAERKELLVKDFHFQRIDHLLSAFQDDKSGILRFVWIIRKGEPLFNEEWESYCGQILKGTAEGGIRAVRALLVLGEGVSEDDVIIKKLAGFYEFTKRHDYRIVGESKYNLHKADSRIEDSYIDFGIYGSRYIFLTQSYGEITAGKFCKDPAVISRYSRFFDLVWASHFARKLPKASVLQTKLAELFHLGW